MSKIYNAVMGLVVGDALGVPVEFKRRDTYHIEDMIGFGTYNQPPGTWSDDSSMTLATLESIGRVGDIDPVDIMGRFADWYFRGQFTPHGEVFDVGGTTRRAIQRFRRGVSPLECGDTNEQCNGNGALMRILPVALFHHDTELIDTLVDVKKVGSLTHAHNISQYGCYIYTAVVQRLFKGESKCSAVVGGYGDIEKLYSSEPDFAVYQRIPYIADFGRDEIDSSGYVVDTLESALWCFLKTSTYEDCILTAVNLGKDTDTVAAVAGGVAGLYYGCGDILGIPDEWISQIARQEWIQELCNKI